ncbi:MAG: hypothetical protein ABMA64_34810 [Myxococcota bacterium]
MQLWVSMAFAADPCSDPAQVAAVTAEVTRLYDEGEADKADRSATATSVLARDEARVKDVQKLDRKGELCAVEDKWRAAWIMTQSDDLDVLERAYALAEETMNAHYANGAWLVAFTFDLKRTAGGFRQSYGSQTRVNERSQICLIEVEPDVTDAERAAFGQRPIAEVYRSVLDQNGFQKDPATLETVKKRGLYCPPVAISRSAQKKVAPPPQ